MAWDLQTMPRISKKDLFGKTTSRKPELTSRAPWLRRQLEILKEIDHNEVTKEDTVSMKVEAKVIHTFAINYCD